MFAYTLKTAEADGIWGQISVGIVTFYAIFGALIVYMFVPNDCCGSVKKMSPFEFTNGSALMRIATLAYYEMITVVIIQLLSLVIANPILGRPIAFTPRGETFGIMFGIIAAIHLLALIIYGIYRGIRWYANKNWINRTDVIIDRQPNNV